uniref:Alcohol dehydrogenase-like C-terminal domain-containing protein n=1 Tax=Phytophthora ramorum TaxID=164328 RepID=H3HA90_PHYRM
MGDRVGVGAPCEECTDGENAFCNRSVITYEAKYEDGLMAFGGYADYKHSVKPGDRGGVIGIGGLGHLAIQFTRALGATPVAFSRSANKEKEIRALGAEEFYNVSDPEDEKTAGNSVNMLLLTADANSLPFSTYLSLVKKCGTFIMESMPNDEVKFKPMFVVAKGIKWVSSLIGSIQDVKDILELASKKNVRAIVQQMPMSEPVYKKKFGKELRERIAAEMSGDYGELLSVFDARD